MLRKLTNPSAAWLLTGLVIGLGIAVFLQGQPTFATATDRSDEFAIATGLVSTELEAVYLLDFKNAQLLGTVMNRQNGRFQQFYRRDLASDFFKNMPKAPPKPKFIMVTGLMQNAQSQVPVNHVLYVAELNTGRLLAYAMPYRGDVLTGTTAEQLMPLHETQFRQTTGVRPQ
jgi:hypothetical protein